MQEQACSRKRLSRRRIACKPAPADAFVSPLHLRFSNPFHYIQAAGEQTCVNPIPLMLENMDVIGESPTIILNLLRTQSTGQELMTMPNSMVASCMVSMHEND